MVNLGSLITSCCIGDGDSICFNLNCAERGRPRNNLRNILLFNKEAADVAAQELIENLYVPVSILASPLNNLCLHRLALWVFCKTSSLKPQDVSIVGPARDSFMVILRQLDYSVVIPVFAKSRTRDRWRLTYGAHS